MSKRSIPALLAVLAVGLFAWMMVGVPATAGTLTGTFYADPNSSVKRWLAANPNDSRAPLIAARIGSQPQGRWFSNYSPSTVQADVTAYVNAANAANQIPVLIPYMVPNRDCGGASAGGAPTYPAYDTWARSFAAGLGNRLAVVLLEPDSLALQTCLSATERATRNASISGAVTAMKNINPNVKVYLDAGHSAWNSATDTANRLRDAGVANSAGFYSNMSNYRWTADEINFGRNVINALGNANMHQVIDVSRNGRGPLGSEWCDPAGRGTGVAPTTNTGESTVDAFVWAKPPGEADGCRAAAGQFVPDLAFELAQNGIGPTSSPSVSPSVSASPSRSTSPSPSVSPSRSTSPSPSVSPSTSPNPGGCLITLTTQSSWANGYVIQPARVTNTSNATITWRVTVTLPPGHTIAGFWNATQSISGQTITYRGVSHNGTLAPGASGEFGFQVNRPSGNTATPTAICATS